MKPPAESEQAHIHYEATELTNFDSLAARKEYLSDILFSCRPGAIRSIPGLLATITFVYERNMKVSTPEKTISMIKTDLAMLQRDLIEQSDDLSSIAAAQAGFIRLFLRNVSIIGTLINTENSSESVMKLFTEEMALLLSELLRQLRFRILDEEEEDIVIVPGLFPTKNGQQNN